MDSLLLVEDEPVTASKLQKILEKLGYHVLFVATTGEEAISLAEKFTPDLILMDVVLKNKIEGTQAVPKYIQFHSNTPIFILTAYNHNDIFNRTKLSAPYGYITMPYDDNTLRMTIDLALARRRMEIESEKEIMNLKNHFISNMSHELRSPLNTINTFIELLDTGKIDLQKADHKEMTKAIQAESHKLIGLVDTVLQLTEIESGKFAFNPINIDTHKLLLQTVNISHAREKNITIKINIDPSLNSIVIDPDMFRAIFNCYLSNAIKFSPAGSNIDVSVRPENEKCFRLEVKDNGVGIREEDLNKIFVPFQQVDMSMQKKYRGAGLGLFLARRIVEVQNGRVGVESKFGDGSLFWAVLPRKSALAFQTPVFAISIK